MNHEKMGPFIAELRKGKQMTQKDLAAQLNITDKAVSKWERGLSCPDISLLSSIAEILGVSTGELLNGETSSAASKEALVNADNALLYAKQAVKSKAKSVQNISAAAFSVSLLLGIAVCALCDLAIFSKFTWSLLPMSAIVFSWLLCFPLIKFGLRGIYCSMIALSLLTIPFLYLLNLLIEPDDLFLPIGIPTAAVGIVYSWLVFAVFKKLPAQKLIAGGVSLLLSIPLSLFINLILSKIIAEQMMDVWDIFNFMCTFLAAIALFALDFSLKKRKLKEIGVS